ncbi:SUKH-3 domain-containing protein [Xenorhabdus bovienii]|uniref:SUKH-3 domain-containing protein n=1 Tax=Xenorhabdus bovienii TaxID=40576 RepID=UPI0023B32592|nr:SUKH-3 domain-containing protein [Xenorhabdus bovienii]MDE9435287.1 SUKH-3 domain-containing protein [Xenorhabdus bovienii]MDE9497094.1 SUKH-3 domain-containing protein [Xenorhabdus bovienii]
MNFIELTCKYGEVYQEKLDVTNCVNFLMNEKFNIFSLYLEFITNYGGIKEYHSEYKNNEAKPEKFHTDPIEASKLIPMDWIEEYEDRTSCKLIPFGECCNGYITLILGSDGKIYGAFDNSLFQYGNDILSGLDVLINGKNVLEIN